MSSTTIVSNSTSSVQINNIDKVPSSTITTTAKSSTTTITPSSKKLRKSEINSTDGYLPIAPHQTPFYSHNQGLTLASLQQQQLQSGNVVFSPSTMMTTLATGPQGQGLQQHGQPQAGQQLVVATGPGQTMGPAFNTGNGQGLIQAAPGMITGLNQVQMIQSGGGGQPTAYTFQPVYTNHTNVQPMLLGQNFVTFPQNPTQGLAIQIPNGNSGGTMITTNQLTGNAPTTPVKNQGQNQSIIKSAITISPQQTQATKSSVNNGPNTGRVQSQLGQQQQAPTIIQPAFNTTPGNQTFVIGTFQNSATNQPNGTAILPNTSTSGRKNTVSLKNKKIINRQKKIQIGYISD